ncbi:phage tail sheath subtilisin-like domain-containing protein [Streptosporangium sp. NPDC023825]|uniref:phage tail sheath family protein n=1 Tax=Streptosporangium sp. NPDC023825 TaxID=3154909 RepID=UPI00342F0A67
MATNYLTPGVYVEEDLSPKGGSGYGDARAIAAFVGVANKGPAVPTLITSWTQYTNHFGGFTGNSFLPFAVSLYFANGGNRCYIQRAVRSDAVAAVGKLVDSTPGGSSGPLDAVKLEAIAPGTTGNTLTVQVVPTGAVGRFHLLVLNSGFELERFEDLSINPDDSRYAISIVNSPFAGSQTVKLTNLKVNSTYTYHATNDVLPAQTATMGTGSEGVAPYDLVAAAKKFEDLDVNIDLNLPGITSITTLNPIMAWAKETGKVFVVIDGPKAAEGSTSAQVLAGYTGMVGGATPLTASSHGALYGPWLMCSDPSTSLYGAVRLLPPGGAILGRYAANDSLRHVGKAPAGIETRLNGVLATETRFTKAELDAAAEDHINIIRQVPGHGICVMGSRTLKLELPDRYVPVRRLLILLRKQLADITRFAIFEPNGPELWLQITLVVSRYLSILRRAGVLAGSTDNEAFFVKCDADNNPQSKINAGMCVIDVGIAFKYPAEFIVIRIGQHDAGASTSEDSIPGITG